MVGVANIAAAGDAPGRLFFVWRWPRRRTAASASAPRVIIILALLGMGATLLSAGLGYGLAWQGDARAATEQRAALRGAIGEYRALFRNAEDVDPRFVRMVEQVAGLKGLKFEAEPALTSARHSRCSTARAVSLASLRGMPPGR